MIIPFVGPAYNGRSTMTNPQECVNFYPEINDPGSKTVSSLIACPGTYLLCNTGISGANRALYKTSTGRLFCVTGNTLCEISTVWDVTSRGTLLTSTGNVNMIDNGNHIGIVDGAYLYHYNLSTDTLTRVTAFSGAEPFTLNPSHIAFVAGYLVINHSNSGRFYHSDLYDATSWDILSYFTAEGSPDDLIALTSVGNDLWLLSEQSSEIYYYTGDTSELFARVSGSVNEYGIAARYSLATDSNVVFWLGSSQKGSGTVWMATGYQPQRISTHGIEYHISQMTDYTDAIGYCYSEEGHFFYVLSFRNGNKTFAYDVTTGLWHERGIWDSVNYQFNQLPWQYCANFGEKNVMADYDNANLYDQNLNYYDYNGDYKRCVRTSPCISSENKRIFYTYAELDAEVGVGLISNQGSDPKAMLQWSDNGGMSFKNEHWRTLGKRGEYGKRVRWNQLGSSRRRVFRIAVTDAVKLIINGMYAGVYS
jgi:hypothetical protein